MKLVREQVRATTVTTNTGSVELFLEHYNTNNIKEVLIHSPETIAYQKEIIRLKKDRFKEADLPRQMLEVEMIDDIMSEINPATGKAMYSNEKARDNELAKRKAESQEYKKLTAQAREVGRELAAAEDELEMLVDKFKAYRYVAALVTAEIGLIAGSLAEEWPAEEVNAVNNGTNQEQEDQPLY